jgi:hypothetical protein
MKTKNIIIVGLGLAVVGGGAYFYIKSKNKKNNSSVPALNESIVSNTQAVDVKDTVLDTAPITNAQSQANQLETTKQIQAQGLITQIFTLKTQYPSLQSPTVTCNFPIFGDSTAKANYSKCNQTKAQILDIQNQLNALGYKEDNGVAVKL